ncbi:MULTISPECIES: hypothetical protein [Vibrio]|uniref:Uncharacterized protein n=2 Tax=Vibrio coralliilyticus TaxID=190893 RepID=A0AAN0W000_9VIBR|nr:MULTISPECIES: hypothetical protein [Vibrio]AIS57995.1 hypothetical protein JV59_23825 [Vibrio coralliilyticus]AIW22042.1 hypothetical protein IX92_24035 [Vibrio coralliilyticus]ERB65723.1 hypothetical protein N779_08510 [Vibrio coralliilyticus OCN008]MCM5507637.1 hypothetical protein [Vibrio sp. SCSIO 43169]MDE3899477.1 hypothetical protein [Vibrio sp. CC007]
MCDSSAQRLTFFEIPRLGRFVQPFNLIGVTTMPTNTNPLRQGASGSSTENESAPLTTSQQQAMDEYLWQQLTELENINSEEQ